MKNSEKTLDMIVNLCKNRGFIYPGSEIYGGLANSWDYGPLGVEFKNNVKKAWMEEIRAGKPLQRRAGRCHPDEPPDLGDHRPRGRLLGPAAGLHAPARAATVRTSSSPSASTGKGVDVDAMTFDEMDEFIASHHDVVCPVCGKHDFTPIRKFNLMFKTCHRRHRGFLLRPATCAPRPRRASSSTLRTSSAPPAASCPSASARSARRSATRSPRATSPSAPASLSRWSASSSASPAPIWSGSLTGRTTARTGC